MTSQSSQNYKNVEVIDLTNETTKQNTTITIDDSLVVSEVSEDEDVQPHVYNYSSNQSPIPIPIDSSDGEEVISDHASSKGSSLPSRIPSSPSSSFSPIRSPLPSYSFSPSPRRLKTPMRSTPIVSQRQEKLLNKNSKEEAKRQKLKQKEEERLQKEANRANAANKAFENCTAEIDKNIPALINDQEEISFKTLFDESMVKYSLSESSKIDNIIRWTYKRTEIVDGACVPRYKTSSWLALVMPGSEYLKKILAFRDSPESAQSIKNYLNFVRQRTHLNVILMVYNLANYLKTERAKEAKNYRKTFKDRFEGTQNEGCQEEVSSALSVGLTELQDLRLLLEMDFKRQHKDWKLHVEFYEKTTDIVQSIVRCTLSVAKLEAKVKARESTGLDWAINMDKEKAVDPTKSIDDLKQLWITQLQQFSQVTLPIAKAIASEYPSPWALLSQYLELTSSEAENLLAELHVQRNLKRQIGTNISKRIHCFMTSRDPDVHIGLT